MGETMSSIGPGNIGALNIAGSFAGAQRTEAETNRSKAEAATQRGQVDPKSMSTEAVDDVAEADLSEERDPDGRMSYGGSWTSDDSPDTSRDQTKQPDAVPDAFGERGNSLDLEA